MKKFKNIFIFSFLSFFSFYNRALAAADCKKTVGSSVAEFIVDFFMMIRWIALALAIVLGILDFFKAITGGKDDALKKAGQTFAKRIIAVAILMILPQLLEWILDISGIDHGGTCL